MPPKSQAQRRFGFAAAAGKIPGVPKKVGVEFEGPGLKGLPAKVRGPRPFAPRAPKVPGFKTPVSKANEPGFEPLQTMHTSQHH